MNTPPFSRLLSAFELRLSLFFESLHALSDILAGEDGRHHEARPIPVLTALAVEHPFYHPLCQRRSLLHTFSELHNLRHQLVMGNHLVYEPYGLSFLSGESGTGQSHVCYSTLPHMLGAAQQCLNGYLSPVDLLGAEFGFFRSNNYITGKRDAGTESEGIPVDSRNHRLRQVFDMHKRLSHILDELHTLNYLVELELAHIGAGAEGIALAGQDDYPDVIVFLDVGQSVLGGFEHLRASG